MWTCARATASRLCGGWIAARSWRHAETRTRLPGGDGEAWPVSSCSGRSGWESWMDVDPAEWRRHQRYLLAVAYRLLGSLTEAEDAVQEAYLRLAGAEATDVGDLRAWLSTVVSRICLDQLRSARARRESYVGPWLPEPLVGDALAPDPPEPDPAERVTLAESVHMAMLIVLETLSPAERVAFVLHDVFGLSFAQTGRVVGRTPGACRQLASRARRDVRAR